MLNRRTLYLREGYLVFFCTTLARDFTLGLPIFSTYDLTTDEICNTYLSFLISIFVYKELILNLYELEILFTTYFTFY